MGTTVVVASTSTSETDLIDGSALGSGLDDDENTTLPDVPFSSTTDATTKIDDGSITTATELTTTAVDSDGEGKVTELPTASTSTLSSTIALLIAVLLFIED